MLMAPGLWHSGVKYLEAYNSTMKGIREEAQRQHRVLDMMLTMHAILRDRYRRWALYMSIILLCTSFLLVAGIFTCTAIVDKLKIEPAIVEGIISICSLIVFLVALIEVKVDWKEQAGRHESAYKALQKLKVISKGLLVDSILSDEKIREKWLLINATLNEQYPIPEKEFARLKAAHLRKVEISKLIGENPGCGVFLLRLGLFCRSVNRVLRKKSS